MHGLLWHEPALRALLLCPTAQPSCRATHRLAQAGLPTRSVMHTLKPLHFPAMLHSHTCVWGNFQNITNRYGALFRILQPSLPLCESSSGCSFAHLSACLLDFIFVTSSVFFVPSDVFLPLLHPLVHDICLACTLACVLCLLVCT